jgi:GTP-binding protein Era
MKAGFIAVVGRPNVGKSTLINKIVSEKVAITSDKSGTTRENIKGILNKNGNQYVFIDTPGIHKPRNLLGTYMTRSAVKILSEVDVILFLLDGTALISTGDQFVMERILEAKRVPRILILNKMDRLSDEKLMLKQKEVKEKLGIFDDYLEISGKYGFGIEKLLRAIHPFLEDNAVYYPEDMYTDMPVYRMITEIIREKILMKTREEIPHSVAVEIIHTEQRKQGADKFQVNIYVERNSQKGIIIGKNGNLLKEIGTEARVEIERLLDHPIYLELWVKVKENWRKKKPFLKEMGYNPEM